MCILGNVPRVERDAEVTLVVLTYRSLRWLDFAVSGVDTTYQRTRYRWLVVANDAIEEVRVGLSERNLDWIDFRSANPTSHYIPRVYAAWREGVLCSPTQWCILTNSDMRFSDHAVDELVKCKRRNPLTLPCSLLVENGRIPSGMPEYVKDLGTTPDTFQYDEFIAYAAEIRQLDKLEPGRLFQPCLFDRQEFADLGGYPEEGNVGGVSGDKILFDRYIAAGYKWVTCLGSVVGHVQEGEMRDDNTQPGAGFVEPRGTHHAWVLR